MSMNLLSLKGRMKDFIDETVIPAEPALLSEDASALMEDLKAQAKAQGLWALGHPAELGGGGLPFLDFAQLNEIIGRSYFGQMAVGSISMQDSIMLHQFGSEAQREAWLEPLVAGDIYPSVGLTEPDVAGSDPTLMQSRGELDGNEWLINGRKWFTSGANVAAFTTVFCETEPEQQRHGKFSAIIVPTNTPGYRIKRVVKTMGDTVGGHCEL